MGPCIFLTMKKHLIFLDIQRTEMNKIILLQLVTHDVENRGLHSLCTSTMECYGIIKPL